MFLFGGKLSCLRRPILHQCRYQGQLIKSKNNIRLISHESCFDIEWPGSPQQESSKFHFVWLRDNCQCDKCLHPSTRQKLISSGSVDLEVKPLEWHLDSEQGLEITWSGNSSHKSRFDWNFLQRYSYSRQSDKENALFRDHPFSVWDRKSLVEGGNLLWKNYFDLESSTAEEHLSHIVDHLQRYGIVFVKGLPQDEKAVEKVAEYFGPIRETFYGRSWDVKSTPKAINIAYTDLFLGLHMDLLSFESPPGLQFLHCLKQSKTGGESIFLDSFKAVKIMQEQYPDELKILESTPVSFHYHNNGHHLRFTRPTIQSRDMNHGYQVNYAPPFQAPLMIDSNMVEPFYRAFRTFENILRDPDLLFTVKLQPGECVIFANRRILHGRLSFNGEESERHLKGTYVDWDVLMDRFRTLRNKYIHKFI